MFKEIDIETEIEFLRWESQMRRKRTKKLKENKSTFIRKNQSERENNKVQQISFRRIYERNLTFEK